jgi:hypothetical protein
MHVNRAFDDSLDISEEQVQVRRTGNSKLKQNEVIKERNEVVAISVQVRGGKVRKKLLTEAEDKATAQTENPGKEIRSKRPRRKKTNSGSEISRSELASREKLTKAQKTNSGPEFSRSELIPGEKPPKAQPKQSSTIKSSTSQSSHNHKKVTWQNQPSKPTRSQIAKSTVIHCLVLAWVLE